MAAPNNFILITNKRFLLFGKFPLFDAIHIRLFILFRLLSFSPIPVIV